MKRAHVFCASAALIFWHSLRAIAAEPPPLFSTGQWIDLTHEFSTETIYWPTASGFALEVEFHGVTPKGFFYAANRYRASEHGGTHLDAPIHFAKERRTADKIPLEQLIGPAVVIDVSEKAASNPDYQIAVADIRSWESKNGRLPDGIILLFHTGFARYWPDAKRYLGTDEKGPEAVEKLHFPGLHPEAARWLVTERRLKAIGLDTASIDYGQSKLFESHRILFEKEIPAFENVAALEKLPPKGAYVVALPMKIKGGSGGPLRIVAWVPGAGSGTGGDALKP
ncbi:MAG: cyclase family protein [Verrucomicrobiota bacterium]